MRIGKRAMNSRLPKDARRPQRLHCFYSSPLFDLTCRLAYAQQGASTGAQAPHGMSRAAHVESSKHADTTTGPCQSAV
jgi:hypothetical protein